MLAQQCVAEVQDSKTAIASWLLCLLLQQQAILHAGLGQWCLLACLPHAAASQLRCCAFQPAAARTAPRRLHASPLSVTLCVDLVCYNVVQPWRR